MTLAGGGEIARHEAQIGQGAELTGEDETIVMAALGVDLGEVGSREREIGAGVLGLDLGGKEDRASGAKTARPGLERALDVLRPGDTLVVWRLDRLGRTLRHLVETVTDLEERGIGFKSLQEAIDTTTSTGTLVFHVFSALAEFERNLIRERTQAGLAAARARGPEGWAATEARCSPRGSAVQAIRRAGEDGPGDLRPAGDLKADAVRLPCPSGQGAGRCRWGFE